MQWDCAFDATRLSRQHPTIQPCATHRCSISTTVHWPVTA